MLTGRMYAVVKTGGKQYRVEETRGRKVSAFTYKSKANQRKRWGHRQTYATVEITGITRG
jgi:ribosomal protein L21